MDAVFAVRIRGFVLFRFFIFKCKLIRKLFVVDVLNKSERIRTYTGEKYLNARGTRMEYI